MLLLVFEKSLDPRVFLEELSNLFELLLVLLVLEKESLLHFYVLRFQIAEVWEIRFYGFSEFLQGLLYQLLLCRHVLQLLVKVPHVLLRFHERLFKRRNNFASLLSQATVLLQLRLQFLKRAFKLANTRILLL